MGGAPCFACGQVVGYLFVLFVCLLVADGGGGDRHGAVVRPARRSASAAAAFFFFFRPRRVHRDGSYRRASPFFV